MDEILEQIEKTKELKLQTNDIINSAKNISSTPIMLMSTLAQTKALDSFDAHATYLACLGEDPEDACNVLTAKEVYKILDLGKNILNAQLDYRLALLNLALKIEKSQEKQENITPDEAKKELRNILKSLKNEINDILEEDD